VFIYEQYAETIRQHYPCGVGRLGMALHFGVDKTVAARHLEKCVERGLLVKSYTWLGRNWRGWVYTMPAPAILTESPIDEELPF